jgi:peptidyl-prolyl cis-trans isomerase D
MLDALRRGAQSWLAKVLFAILIVSFGIFWNVSDMFRGFGRGSIAHVGSETITVPEFQREFQSQLKSLTTEGGQRLTTEQALLFKLDRRALDRLIAQAAVKSHADNLRLALSDETLAEGIRSDPAFAGPDGKFSRAGFEGLLRQMGLTEQGFLVLRREAELRRQLTDALRQAIAVPVPTVERLHAWREETRTLDYVTIDAARAVKFAEPDEAKLKETYESNKRRFMTPEYRKLAVLILSVDELKKEIALEDDELKAVYTDTKDTYDKPERRHVQQISFKDKATAEAARKALAEGKKNFFDVAKEAGAKESDVDLGSLTKKQMIDKKIADAAFAFPRDKISDVIEGQFAPVLVRVVAIEAGKESTFEEVKEQVRDKIAKEKARGLMQERIDLVEEGRNAGKTLKEIGDSLKLRYFDVEATDKSNRTPDGKPALDHPDAPILLKEAFASSPGLQHEPVELPAEAYAWFDVLSVTEEKQKPFEEVKVDVRQVYVENETKRLLDEFAGRLVDRLKGGEAFAKIAADAGGKAETSSPVRRNASPQGLTTQAVQQAFALMKGAAGYVETSDGKSRIVFQVKDIASAPAPTKEQSDTIAGELRRELENELLLAYISALRERLGVTVNKAELARATGAEPEQQ